MRGRSKNKPSTAAGAIASLTSLVSESPVSPEQEGNNPLEPFMGVPSEQGPNQASSGQDPQVTSRDHLTRKFYGRLISEAIEKMPHAEPPTEEKDRDDFKVALQNVRAKRLLAKLLKEEEE